LKAWEQAGGTGDTNNTLAVRINMNEKLPLQQGGLDWKDADRSQNQTKSID